MARLTELRDAAARLSKRDFSARFPGSLLFPVRVVGGHVQQRRSPQLNCTMMHRGSEDEVLELRLARAHTLAGEGVFGRQTNGLTLGRGAQCDVTIVDYTISKQHALWQPATLRRAATLQDLGSRNGTWIDGVRLDSGVPTALPSGTEFRLGRIVLLYLAGEDVQAHLNSVGSA